MHRVERGRVWRLWGGFLGAPLFIGSLLVFGALVPGFSHYTRAVSRLGAWHVPFGLWFDLCGLLLPGILACGVAWEFRSALAVAQLPTRWATGLLIHAVMLALTSVPADFRQMFNSPWTWAHAFFVLGGLPILFIVIPGCAKSLRALGVSTLSTGVFVALGYLPLLEVLLYWIAYPGIVQRLMIVTVYAQIAWLATVLLWRSRAAATRS